MKQAELLPLTIVATVSMGLSRTVQFGSQQPQLVALRFLKRFIIIAEIGAGVEHVLVQEQLVELIAKIIVMGNILLCLAGPVRLLPLPEFHLD